MSVKPFVSVIIPVYGTEKYVPDCLNSILNQTLSNLEVICIDDASPDKCGEILDEYAAKDSRVRVFHLPENHKQGYGRNLGIQHACGEYLYFLDSDDMIEPNTLEELYDISVRENLDAVFFDAKAIFESEELGRIYTPPINERKGAYPDYPIEGTELLELFFRQNEWTCYPQRIFWRREFIIEEEIRNPEGSEHEDEFFAFAGILLAKRARYIRKQYFTLRIRPNSVMTSKVGPNNFHGYMVNFYLMSRFITERNIHTPAADYNVSHMYERCRSIYDRLPDKDALREYCCRREQDKVLYECFEQHVKGIHNMNRIDPGVLRQIRSHSHLYIYGAGIVASAFARRVLAQKDILLDGFLVTEMKDNKTVLFGRPVLVFGETELPEDTLIIAAVSAGLRKEIGDFLDRNAVRWIYHRD